MRWGDTASGSTVVVGFDSKGIAERLSSAMNAQLIRTEIKQFPDGESKVRLAEPKGTDVIVVHSLFPEVDRRLVELSFILHKLKEQGKRVSLVAPYLAYARQNKEFLKGEVVSVKVVADTLETYGVRRLVVVDAHNTESLKLFRLPVHNCVPIAPLASYVSRKFRLRDPISVAPDEGSEGRVSEFAEALGTDSFWFHKSRDRVTGEITTSDKKVDLKGRDAVIIDDLISTGSTIANCTKLLKKHGAGKVVAACTHALLVGNAVHKMRAAGLDSLVATNTIPGKYSKVDVSPLIVDCFKK